MYWKLFSILVLLQGCTPYDYSKKEASKEDVFFLCYNYARRTHIHNIESPNIVSELYKRNIFTNKEWDYIKKGSLFEGMSYDAVICSISVPSYKWKNTLKWEKKPYYAIEYFLDAKDTLEFKTETSILAKYVLPLDEQNSLFVYFDRKTDKVIKWEIGLKTSPNISLMKEILEKNKN